MPDPVVQPVFTAAEASAWPRWRAYGLCVLFSVLWIDLVRQLSYTWETREQYSYGWFVPFFALYFFWRRWLDRPAATGGGSPRWLTIVVGLALFALLPLRVIFEINADWPLVSWLYTSIVVGLTLHAMFLAGGRGWARHFSFPIAFILLAVAWPYRVENGLTQNLMQVAAGVTVEILGFLNIPALQRGNLIELSTGVLGVNEACSGIRSFQSTLMASLLMGELYRFRLAPRAALLGFGLVMAFVFNAIRTLFLGWQASMHGVSAIAKWHDSAGLTILVACFFALWLLAVLIKRRLGSSAHGGSVSSPSTSHFPLSSLESRACRRYLVAVGLWSLLCVFTTAVWYRSHEAADTSFVRWSVTVPTTKPAYKVLELPPRTLQLLGYDSATATRWHEQDGSKWDVYFFQWHGKSIQSIMAARYHRPEVCLPASGLKQISDSRTDYFQAGGLSLPFRKSSYSAPGQTLHVFYCLWQDGDERREGMRSQDRGDRLLGAIEGRRRFGQQVLEIVTDGYANAAEAEQAVRQQLPNLVRVAEPTDAVRPAGSQ